VKVLFIDNGGFTYNLVEEFKKRDCEVEVYGNDVDANIIDNVIKKSKPKLIVISGNAKGNAIDIVMAYQGQIPIFGVGYKHLIGAFEGKVSSSIVGHGKIIKVNHDDKSVFKKIDNPFDAGVYNSLSASDVPYDLEVSSRSENDVVMGIRHKEVFVEGIQFDPGSLLTASGGMIIDNLLSEIGKK
jgi:anthranilate synthase/aminodeoxychorismate synthase-like glutamine amidotransferase